MNVLESSESLVKKAAYLKILAKTLVEGLKNGNYRSLFHSQGIEFSGVRDYIRGDDIRSIDWNVTARMGKPYVKIFEEEHELEIMVIVDSSLSMHVTNKKSKYATAANAAALLTLAAQMALCPVGTIIFDGKINYYSKPKMGKEHVMTILTNLDKNTEFAQKGTVLSQALTLCERILKKRTLVCVFSDFRTGDWEQSLIALAPKNDVIAFRITDKMDEELPDIGTVPFVDVESGIKMQLASNSKELKKSWKDYNQFLQYKWKECCVKHGILPVSLKTTDELLNTLSCVFGNPMER